MWRAPGRPPPQGIASTGRRRRHHHAVGHPRAGPRRQAVGSRSARRHIAIHCLHRLDAACRQTACSRPPRRKRADREQHSDNQPSVPPLIARPGGIVGQDRTRAALGGRCAEAARPAQQRRRRQAHCPKKPTFRSGRSGRLPPPAAPAARASFPPPEERIDPPPARRKGETAYVHSYCRAPEKKKNYPALNPPPSQPRQPPCSCALHAYISIAPLVTYRSDSHRVVLNACGVGGEGRGVAWRGVVWGWGKRVQ